MKGVEILLSHINTIATFKTSMNNKYYTYAYLRKDKTPYYIGKGKLYRAFKKDKNEVNPPKDKSRIIFLKQNLTEEEAFKHEIYMIAVFGRKDLGTGILRNKTNGGEGSSGFIHSKETKRKLSELNKGENNPSYGKRGEKSPLYGRTLSKETKRKLSEVKKGKNGKLHTEETKRKMSVVKKGKLHTEETKRKMSELNKGANNPNYGKSPSKETRRKMSEATKGERNPNYGKLHTEETKRKMSEQSKGKKWWNNGFENKMSIECPGDEWSMGRVGYKRGTEK
jgi:ribosomal protein S20